MGNIREKIEDAMNASVLNQAGDYAINEYLPNLPKKLKCFQLILATGDKPLTLKSFAMALNLLTEISFSFS